MKHSITHEDLDWSTNRLNEILKPAGINFVWNRRYGYYALDYFRGEERGLETHRSGLTKIEVYQILQGMILVADVLTENRRTKAQDFIEYALGI
jgi:hypothetical protein